MVQVETLMTGIVDKYTNLKRTKWTRLLTVMVVCTCGFMLGLPSTTQVLLNTSAMTSPPRFFHVLLGDNGSILIPLDAVLAPLLWGPGPHEKEHAFAA